MAAVNPRYICLPSRHSISLLRLFESLHLLWSNAGKSLASLQPITSSCCAGNLWTLVIADSSVHAASAVCGWALHSSLSAPLTYRSAAVSWLSIHQLLFVAAAIVGDAFLVTISPAPHSFGQIKPFTHQIFVESWQEASAAELHLLLLDLLPSHYWHQL